MSDVSPTTTRSASSTASSRPEDAELETPRANRLTDAYPFSENDWGGVKCADVDFEHTNVSAMPFSAQIRVAVARGYAPIGTLPDLRLNCSLRPA